MTQCASLTALPRTALLRDPCTHPDMGLQLCPAWTSTKLDAASPGAPTAVCSSLGVISRGYGQHLSAQHSPYTSWLKLPVYFDHAFTRELCCYSSGKLSVIA